jgi:hypothetical protein
MAIIRCARSPTTGAGTGELLPIMLRPGNPNSNTIADDRHQAGAEPAARYQAGPQGVDPSRRRRRQPRPLDLGDRPAAVLFGRLALSDDTDEILPKIPQVNATGITRHQEKISSNVMGCVLDRS